uniref:hypothetical protein n=1 Tax=uncultured Caulobacter sp. TaxID=158749 RepID=UPI0025F97BCD|nr:hypothetical protein [uncultured Caulobacter sp.]
MTTLTAYAFKTAFVIALGAASAALAQAPQIATVPANSNPPVPAGLKVTCTPNPNTGAPSPTCPIIQYNGVTTWAYSFIDNRVSYGIVSYDAGGNVLRNVEYPGARYVYKMTVDPNAQTVSVWGQSNAKVDVAWRDLPGVSTGPVYTWTSTATPPANVVRSPTAPQVPVCRGIGPYNGLWAGWWDGSACNGSYGGNRMAATQNVQFLTLVSGSPNWVAGRAGNQFNPLPPNTINAGKTYSGYDQLVCAYMGLAGWIYSNTCEVNGSVQGANIPYVLTGTVR